MRLFLIDVEGLLGGSVLYSSHSFPFFLFSTTVFPFFVGFF